MMQLANVEVLYCFPITTVCRSGLCYVSLPVCDLACCPANSYKHKFLILGYIDLFKKTGHVKSEIFQKDVYSVKIEGVDREEMPNSDRKCLFNPESIKVNECEIVGILSRIIAETETVLTQTWSALQLRQVQLEQRQLRSRQRDNFMRLLAL